MILYSYTAVATKTTRAFLKRHCSCPMCSHQSISSNRKRQKMCIKSTLNRRRQRRTYPVDPEPNRSERCMPVCVINRLDSGTPSCCRHRTALTCHQIDDCKKDEQIKSKKRQKNMWRTLDSTFGHRRPPFWYPPISPLEVRSERFNIFSVTESSHSFVFLRAPIVHRFGRSQQQSLSLQRKSRYTNFPKLERGESLYCNSKYLHILIK